MKLLNIFHTDSILSKLAFVFGFALLSNALAAEEVKQQATDTISTNTSPTEDKSKETEQSTDISENENEVATCQPPCRLGYKCYSGVCKSPCNPECRKGYICTRNGHCVPQAPQSYSDTTQLTARAVPKATFSVQDVRLVQENAKYNQWKYQKFKNKRVSGISMIVTGSLLKVTASVLGSVALVKNNAGENADAMMWTSIGAEVVADLLIIAGIVNSVTGRVGMYKAQKGFYKKTTARKTGPGFAGISPMLSPDPHRGLNGASFNFYF